MQNNCTLNLAQTCIFSLKSHHLLVEGPLEEADILLLLLLLLCEHYFHSYEQQVKKKERMTTS